MARYRPDALGPVVRERQEPELRAVEGCFACSLHAEAMQTPTVRRAFARHLAREHGGLG